LDYPGPVHVRLRLPEKLPAGPVSEPLLVGGVTGGGDFVGIHYGPDGMVRFSYDHWGAGQPPESEPVKLEPGRDYDLLISAGFLLPPAGAPLFAREPHWAELGKRVIVAVDGVRVFDVRADSHPSTPGQITLGANYIGGSTTGPGFQGSLGAVRLAGFPEVTR
jgi:hypothetical protein